MTTIIELTCVALGEDRLARKLLWKRTVQPGLVYEYERATALRLYNGLVASRMCEKS